MESSYSSAATSRAHSLEVGENPPALEAGATGKPGPPEKKGHSRSRSWVAAVTAPFSRSASGAMKSAEEVRAASMPAGSCSLDYCVAELVSEPSHLMHALLVHEGHSANRMHASGNLISLTMSQHLPDLFTSSTVCLPHFCVTFAYLEAKELAERS